MRGRPRADAPDSVRCTTKHAPPAAANSTAVFAAARPRSYDQGTKTRALLLGISTGRDAEGVSILASYFEEYCARILRGGAVGVIASPVLVQHDAIHSASYVPFEHRNPGARLALVSLTPGHTHVRLAAELTARLLATQRPGRAIQCENKREVELGGALIRPNLIRMLDHFQLPRLLGIAAAASLWSEAFDLLQPLALLPHATTRRGQVFDGALAALLDVPMLRAIYDEHFLGLLPRLPVDMLYLGLGRTAWAGLLHAAALGLLPRRQLLGMLPVPARAGNMVRYFLREIHAHELSGNDPVRHRLPWLDAARAELEAAISARLAGQAAPRGTLATAG